MDKRTAQRLLSGKRFNKYLHRCNNDFHIAMSYYIANTKISESLYWTLHVFEVVFRNKIHQRLTAYHRTEEWYNRWLLSDEYVDFHGKILSTKKIIRKRKEEINPDKMVAEFTLGFWITMFNSKYEKLLWKPLRLVFENIPKPERKRKKVSGFINKIRVFRNRTYHYEPICWDFYKLKYTYRDLLTAIQWLDTDAEQWCVQNCEFLKELKRRTNDLRELGIKKLPQIIDDGQ